MIKKYRSMTIDFSCFYPLFLPLHFSSLGRSLVLCGALFLVGESVLLPSFFPSFLPPRSPLTFASFSDLNPGRGTHRSPPSPSQPQSNLEQIEPLPRLLSVYLYVPVGLHVRVRTYLFGTRNCPGPTSHLVRASSICLEI